MLTLGKVSAETKADAPLGELFDSTIKPFLSSVYECLEIDQPGCPN